MEIFTTAADPNQKIIDENQEALICSLQFRDQKSGDLNRKTKNMHVLLKR